MSIVENAKEIYELLKTSATIELRERIMNLREEAMQLQEENINLKTKVKELESKLHIQECVQFEGVSYWKKLPDGSKDGPFCQACYDLKKTLVRLHANVPRSGIATFQCKVCQNHFTVHEDISPIPFKDTGAV